ncbi:MAG: hypothetical protein Kow0099_29360 [Candidatus Abyssubacteria bacterium]
MRVLMTWFKKEAWLVGVTLAAGAVCVCFSRLDLNFFLPYYFSDIGHQLSNYETTYRGGVPYLDFWENWAPGSFYLNALAFSWFGVSIYSTKLFLALTLTVCALALFLIARRVVSETVAAAVVVVALLWGNVTLNIPYSGWFAICFSLVALLFLLISQEERSRAFFWLFLSGVALGIAFSVKQNIGVFSSVALATASVAAIHTVERSQYVKPGNDAGSKRFRILFILMELFLLALGCLVFPFLVIRTIKVADAAAGLEYFVVFFLPVIAIDALVAISLLKTALYDTTVDFRRMSAAFLKKGAALACGFILVIAPWFVWFSEMIGWGDFYRIVLLTHPLQENFKWAYPGFGRLGGLSAGQVSRFALFLALCAVSSLLFIYSKTRRALVIYCAVAVALLLLIGLEIGQMGAGYAGMFYYTPFLAGVAVAYLLRMALKEDGGGKNARGDFPLLAITLLATYTYMTLGTFADGTHYHMVIFPWIVIGGWGFSLCFKKACSILPNPAFAAKWRKAGLLLATGLPFFGPLTAKAVALLHSQYEQNIRYCEESEAAEPVDKVRILARMDTGSKGGIYINGAFLREVDEVVLHVKTNTSEDDYLLVIPSSGVFNFLADREPPSKYRYFLFSFLSEVQQSELLEDLRETQPPYIVLDTGLASNLYRNTLKLVTGYMDGRYTWERQVGRFHLFRRNTALRGPSQNSSTPER